MSFLLKIKLFLPIFGLFILLLFFVGVGGIDEADSGGSDHDVVDGPLRNVDLPEAVLKWQKEVERAAAEHDISHQVPILLAIMMVETRGESPDLFQASESLGLPVNTLNEEESIAQGVFYYSQAYKAAKEAGCDEWTAAQSYNFGLGYISYISRNGKVHKTDIAEAYSRSVVAPSLGNTTGARYGYFNAVSIADGRTYLYRNGGNFHYVGLLQQYVVATSVSGDYILPLDPPNISSWYGWRIHPNSQTPNFHRGIDFAHPQGTPIKAIADGEVIASEFHASWGNYVRIRHGNGHCTLYAHNLSNKVKVGDKVKQGDVIGLVGTTGDSSGPHLHLEYSTSDSLSQDALLDPAEVLGLKN